MSYCTAHVCFRGKADMMVYRSPLLRSLLGVKRTWVGALQMSAFDPKRTFGSSCLARLRSDAAQTFQFGLPNLSFQSLITPGGNSRLPTPVRRQASGHISSKEWSSQNRSSCETLPVSEYGLRSAAIFRSSRSGAISFTVFMTTPFILGRRLQIPTDN